MGFVLSEVLGARQRRRLVMITRHSVPDWLLPWPHLTALLDGYLARLGKLPALEVDKSWLCRACRSAQGRPEARQHLDALEEAASLCDDAAGGVLRKKFEGTLPRSPTAWNRDYGDRFLDVVVELAAYGWLRGEYHGQHIAYAAVVEGRSPDLHVQSSGEEIGVECKNVHMSTGVRDTLDVGSVVSGHVGLNQAFIDKVREKLDAAIQQLARYAGKIVFLNVTLDFNLWPIEPEVGDAIQAITPAGCRLVVFLNYGWAEPRWMFQGQG